MKVRFLTANISRRAISAAGCSDVGLAADDGLDPFRVHRVVERDRAVHVAMISHGTCVHPKLLGAFG